MNKPLKTILSLMVLPIALGSCGEKKQVKTESTMLLEGTLTETPCYTYEFSSSGPRIAIVGGTHGDETAGWKAAEKLVEDINILGVNKGSILLIPYANVIADNVINRYPGVNTSGYLTNSQIYSLSQTEYFKSKDLSSLNSTKFTDLNRAFPGSNNDSSTITQKLAYSIFNTIVDFEPDFVIDLHESRYDHTKNKKNESTYLGNTVIYGGSQSVDTAMDVISDYNDTIKPDGEKDFAFYEGTVKGSLCNSMGAYLTSSQVFTIETNREVSSVTGLDTADETRRVEIQLDVLKLLVSYAHKTSN